MTDIDDSEFLVELRVVADSGKGEGVEAIVAVPSGRLSVGDANAADIVNLRPGRWRLRVEVEPDDMPERVTVWLSPDEAQLSISRWLTITRVSAIRHLR